MVDFEAMDDDDDGGLASELKLKDITKNAPAAMIVAEATAAASFISSTNVCVYVNYFTYHLNICICYCLA